MGRWKDNGQGQAYWDANDNGPDQIQPTADQRAAQQGGAPGQAPSPVPRDFPPYNGQPWPMPVPPGRGGRVPPWAPRNPIDPNRGIILRPWNDGGWSEGGGAAGVPYQHILDVLRGIFGPQNATEAVNKLTPPAASTPAPSPTVSFDPSKRSPNTGINGGVLLGGLGT